MTRRARELHVRRVKLERRVTLVIERAARESSLTICVAPRAVGDVGNRKLPGMNVLVAGRAGLGRLAEMRRAGAGGALGLVAVRTADARVGGVEGVACPGGVIPGRPGEVRKARSCVAALAALAAVHSGETRILVKAAVVDIGVAGRAFGGSGYETD